MIRIAVTPAAYAVIADGANPHGQLPPQGSPTGGFYLWLDKTTANRLKAARGPSESYSDVILRLAKLECRRAA